MEAKAKENKVKTIFENTVIEVKPILRNRGGWYVTGHESQFLTERSYIKYYVPVNAMNGLRYNPFDKMGDGEFERALTQEEIQTIADFYSVGKEKFNVTAKDCFFNKFGVRLDRGSRFLNLSNIDEFVQYRILLTNKHLICRHWAERNNSQEFRYSFVFKEEEKKDTLLSIDEKRKAYAAYGELSVNREKMYEFLLSYWFNNKTAPKPAANMNPDDMKIEISNIIEKSTRDFLEIVIDPDKEYKVLIQKGILKKLIIKQYNKYIWEGFQGTLNEFVVYLKDPVHSEDLLKLKTLTDR